MNLRIVSVTFSNGVKLNELRVTSFQSKLHLNGQTSRRGLFKSPRAAEPQLNLTQLMSQSSETD